MVIKNWAILWLLAALSPYFSISPILLIG
jgi:hypothetical protein